MVCLSGEYTAYLDSEKIVLKAGDELHIPKWDRTVGFV